MAPVSLKQWLLQYFILLGCPSFYLVLLILDVFNSWHTHSYWVAPKFLSLNAFTLQIMSALVDIFKPWRKPKDLVNLINLQHIVDAARLMGCISIAYVIPDVAHYSFHEAWEYLGTLFFIELGQLIYRIYSLLGNEALMKEYYQQNTPPAKDGGKFTYEIKWFIISNGVYLVAVFILLLVLACTLAAGKTMKALAINRITRRISDRSLAMNDSSVPPIPTDEVFYELWHAVRSSRPSNVAARSLLSSASTFIATLLVGFTIAKWSLLSQHDMFFHLERINKVVVVVECIFIMVGWFVLLWRWFATVYYFSNDRSPYYLSKYIIQSEKEVNYNPYISKFFVFQIPTHVKGKILIKVPTFVHHSLKPVFCIMKSFIHLCKTASIIYKSLTKLLLCIAKKIIKIIKSKKQQQAEDYATYINATYINSLSDFTMFGETPESLWRSNFRAFKKVKTQVHEGNKEGKILWGNIQGLCDAADHLQLHFNEECCWKMEMIWYVTVLMCCYSDSNSNSNMKESEEAIGKAIQYGGSNLWNILTFMEQNESKNLIADNEFRRLQRLWQKCCKRRSEAKQYLEDEVKRPLEEAFKKLHCGDDDRDDWKRQEMARYFNIRCKSSVLSSASIDCDKVLADTMAKGTKWILANLYHSIRHCVCEYMHKGVLERCFKWASELDENNLCSAAFEIGKAQGLIEAQELIEAQGLMDPANVV